VPLCTAMYRYRYGAAPFYRYRYGAAPFYRYRYGAAPFYRYRYAPAPSYRYRLQRAGGSDAGRTRGSSASHAKAPGRQACAT
jgi:hypothetical protein